MKKLDKIESVISRIDWTSIRKYHKKLNIFWEIEGQNQKQLKIPTEKDLQDELRSILQYMYEEKVDYMSYSHWVIFWNMDENLHEEHLGQIRVIFRISDYTFTEDAKTHQDFRKNLSQLDINNLEKLLSRAIEEEDYENAAIIRDSIIDLIKCTETNGK